MVYTLVGNTTSPFVRICRLFMVNHSIPYDFKILNFLNDANAAQELARESPINKIPFLIDKDKKIFDSRVIVNHLSDKHKLPKLTIDEENIVSAIYSCIDSGVILVLMKRDGFDVSSPGFFVSRQRERIPKNIDYITPWVKSLNYSNPQSWNYASMSLLSFLYWADLRGVYDCKTNPDMMKFLERYQNSPGVKETKF